jgi:hypothetical protein
MIPSSGFVREPFVVGSDVMLDCRGIARLLGILAWAGAFATMPLSASEPDTKTAAVAQAPAARLLELGDRYSPTALAKARAYHDSLRAKPGDDADVEYALALVLIRQHCTGEAVEVLDAILAHQPDALYLWRAKIWAEMAAHKERDALADVRSVAAILARQSPNDLSAADAEEWRATAEFLGRVFGFLEVPRANSRPADEVRSAKQAVLAGLGDERTEFDESEELVAEKFSKAREAFEQQRAKRLAASKARQDEIGQQKKLIDETETGVDFDTEKVKVNTATEVERLNKAAETLQKYLLVSQNRLNAVRKAILSNMGPIFQQAAASELTAMGVTPSPILLLRQSTATNEQRIGMMRLGAEQNILTQQIQQLTEQLQSTITQRNALLDMGEKTSTDLKVQAASLKRDERRLERAEQAEAKKISTERHKTLLTKQTSFATFEPFAFETEKQRVVGTARP